MGEGVGDDVGDVVVRERDVAGLEWPEEVAAVVACNMIGHLDVDARTRLWARLAAHLTSGGVAVIGLQAPSRPQSIPRTQVAAARVGRLGYRCDAQAVPTGDRSMRWTMTYRTFRDEAVLDEVVTTFDWWTVGPADLDAEASPFGLSVRPAPADLLVLRRC